MPRLLFFALFVSLVVAAVIGIRSVVGAPEPSADVDCLLIDDRDLLVDAAYLSVSADRRALDQEREELINTSPDSERVAEIDQELARLASEEESYREERARRLEAKERLYEVLDEAEKQACQRYAQLVVQGPVGFQDTLAPYAAFTFDRPESGDALMPHCSLGESFISVNTIQREHDNSRGVDVVGIVHNPSADRGAVTLQGFRQGTFDGYDAASGLGYQSIDDKWDFEVSTTVLGSGDDRLAWSVFAAGGSILDLSARAYNVNKSESEPGRTEEITEVYVLLICLEPAHQLHQPAVTEGDTSASDAEPGEDNGRTDDIGGSTVPPTAGQLSFEVGGREIGFQDIPICFAAGTFDAPDVAVVAYGQDGAQVLEGSNKDGFTIELDDGSGFKIAPGEATVIVDTQNETFSITGPATFHDDMSNTLTAGEPAGDATLQGGC